MKRIKFILGCVTNAIKKNIFKSQNTEISQECEKVFESMNLETEPDEKNREAEYVSNYCVTTRWQTL
jgi:hypothetical protein